MPSEGECDAVSVEEHVRTINATSQAARSRRRIFVRESTYARVLFAITKYSASTIAVSSRPGEERPGQASHRACSTRARNRGREDEQSPTTARVRAGREDEALLSSVEEAYRSQGIYSECERERKCVRENDREPELVPSFLAGKEREFKEESPRSTEAVQRLRGARTRVSRPVTRTGEREPPQRGVLAGQNVRVSPRLAPYKFGEKSQVPYFAFVFFFL